MSYYRGLGLVPVTQSIQQTEFPKGLGRREYRRLGKRVFFGVRWCLLPRPSSELGVLDFPTDLGMGYYRRLGATSSVCVGVCYPDPGRVQKVDTL